MKKSITNDNIVLNEHIAWPFYRYKVSLPGKIQSDIFEWLFLSLLLYVNETLNLNKLSYTEEAKLRTLELMKTKFSNIFDNTLVSKITKNVENDFIIINDDNTRSVRKESISFLDTYESLYEDKLKYYNIFQDAITGEVLPYFGECDSFPFIEPNNNEDLIKFTFTNKVDKPSPRAIRYAYKQYGSLTKFVEDTCDTEVNSLTLDEAYDEEIDYGDDQELFDDDDLDFVEEEKHIVKKQEYVKNLDKYDVYYLNDEKVLYYLDTRLKKEDNKIKVISPFENNTNVWLNNCLVKARNVSSEGVDKYIKELEQQYLETEEETKELLNAYKEDFASKLKYCAELFRLVEPIKDNQLKRDIIDLDNEIGRHREISYHYIGNIIEKLMYKIKFESMYPLDIRKTLTKTELFNEIDYALMDKNIIGDFLKSNKIYEEFKNKRIKKNGEMYKHFKSDLVDCVISSDLLKSDYVYQSFIKDLCDLYDKRSANDHGNSQSSKDIEEDNKKLLSCAKVLCDLI